MACFALGWNSSQVTKKCVFYTGGLNSEAFNFTDMSIMVGAVLMLLVADNERLIAKDMCHQCCSLHFALAYC